MLRPSLGALEQRHPRNFWPGKAGVGPFPWMSAQARVRFRALAMLADAFLQKEQHARLQVTWQRPVTYGDARREIQRRHRHRLLCWLHEQFLSGIHPDTFVDLLTA
jgi:hypothetical protein